MKMYILRRHLIIPIVVLLSGSWIALCDTDTNGVAAASEYEALSSQMAAALSASTDERPKALQLLTERVEAFRRSQAASVFWVRATTMLGDLQSEQGRPAEAIRSYDAAIAKIPLYMGERSNDGIEYKGYISLKLAQQLASMGTHEAAIQSFLSAIKGEDGKAPFGVLALREVKGSVVASAKGPLDAAEAYDVFVTKLLNEQSKDLVLIVRNEVVLSCVETKAYIWDHEPRRRGEIDLWFNQNRELIASLPDAHRALAEGYWRSMRERVKAELGFNVDRALDRQVADLKPVPDSSQSLSPSGEAVKPAGRYVPRTNRSVIGHSYSESLYDVALWGLAGCLLVGAVVMLLLRRHGMRK